MTYTREQIDAMLLTNDAAVERAIIRLFTMQNEDEQQEEECLNWACCSVCAKWRVLPPEYGEPPGETDQWRCSALDGVNAAQQRSGDITAAYERGEVTDIAKVMLARQEAGVAFEATLQVRNKLLSAYQEIMRMGV